MYQLYGRAGAGSAAVEALLALIGAEHRYVEVVKNADGTAPGWFLSINPRGEVPALRLEDDSVMTESAAMMIHLADAHPAAGLAPPPGSSQRAQYLRWLVYLAAAPYNSDLRLYYPERYSADASHAAAIREKARRDLNNDYDVFASQLGPGPFMFGNKLTAADIYAAMLIAWADDVPAVLARLPRLAALYRAVTAVPAIGQVWQQNGLFLVT